MAQIVEWHQRGDRLRRLLGCKAASLTFAAIKNETGKYVRRTIAGATAAMEGATVNPDLTYDPLNATGAKSYPITLPTYILVYTTQTDTAVGNALKGFLNYIYGPGQGMAASGGLRQASVEHLEPGQGPSRQDHRLLASRASWGRARRPPPHRSFPWRSIPNFFQHRPPGTWAATRPPGRGVDRAFRILAFAGGVLVLVILVVDRVLDDHEGVAGVP